MGKTPIQNAVLNIDNRLCINFVEKPLRFQLWWLNHESKRVQQMRWRKLLYKGHFRLFPLLQQTDRVQKMFTVTEILEVVMKHYKR